MPLIARTSIEPSTATTNEFRTIPGTVLFFIFYRIYFRINSFPRQTKYPSLRDILFSEDLSSGAPYGRRVSSRMGHRPSATHPAVRLKY